MPIVIPSLRKRLEERVHEDVFKQANSFQNSKGFNLQRNTTSTKVHTIKKGISEINKNSKNQELKVLKGHKPKDNNTP